MAEARVKIGITGASGFIGRHAVRRFAERGHEVHAFQRSAGGAHPAGVITHRFEMPRGIEPRDFAGLDVILHGAVAEYGPAHRDSDDVNREAAKRLIEIARRGGTRLIFLSTLSAHPAARSHYGRSKLELEGMFDPTRDTILRLGLVLGDAGIFGSMVEMIRNASFVPLAGGGRPIQTIWMEDLLDVLERVATQGIAGRYEIATSEVDTMRGLHEAIATGLGVKRTFVPVPLGLIGLAVATLEALRVPFPIRSENVEGLRALRAFDNAKDLERLGLRPRSMRETVAGLLKDRRA